MSPLDHRHHAARIVVGIDGSDAALAAVRYASVEARRTGAGLELVHAAPQLGPLGVAVAVGHHVSHEEHRAVGTRLLDRARKVARGVTGEEWSIETKIRDGRAATALATASAGAVAVVVGAQRRSLSDRLLTGSVVAHLAGTAAVPVVVVPDSWRAGDSCGVVAVGVRDPDAADAAVRRAFAIAADRGARVQVVHAWELPLMYDDLVPPRPGVDMWPAGLRSDLDSLVSRTSADFPHVPVELRLIHGQPARVLCHVSEQVDLLVLMRRRHAFPSGYLGSTARAVLRAAKCPVEVVPSLGRGPSSSAVGGTQPAWDESAPVSARVAKDP